MHNIYYSYFGQSTRMVDSGIFIDKICWFYPNRESTFWTMHAILKLQVPILAMRNNKMGHRINKMWTLINKVGHRNVKLVDTYQQVWFKKQQNGSRVLYLTEGGNPWRNSVSVCYWNWEEWCFGIYIPDDQENTGCRNACMLKVSSFLYTRRSPYVKIKTFFPHAGILVVPCTECYLPHCCPTVLTYPCTECLPQATPGCQLLP